MSEKRATVFVATTLDGFIARENGSIDWLDEANKVVPAGEDCGFGQFFQTIDVLIMGRNTYELVRSFPSWPYGATRVVVLSHSEILISPEIAPTVSRSDLGPKELLKKLENEGFKNFYIDGGQVIQSFIKEGLVDELILTTIPVIIGSGKRIFGQLTQDIHLEHQSTKIFPFGFIQTHYNVIQRK